MSCRFWKCGGFLSYNFLNGGYCCPKTGQISRFFLQSGVPEGRRGGIKVRVQQESCSAIIPREGGSNFCWWQSCNKSTVGMSTNQHFAICRQSMYRLSTFIPPLFFQLCSSQWTNCSAGNHKMTLVLPPPWRLHQRWFAITQNVVMMKRPLRCYWSKEGCI